MHIIWDLLGQNQWWALVLTSFPILWIAFEVLYYFLYGPEWQRRISDPPIGLGGFVSAIAAIVAVGILLALIDGVVYLWTTPS